MSKFSDMKGCMGHPFPLTYRSSTQLLKQHKTYERTHNMVPGFHGVDLTVILVIALLIFGPKKLPEMGAAIGKSMKEFKKGMNDLSAGNDEEPKSNTLRSEERR